MSLINEALKKAQRQRTDTPAPSAPPAASETGTPTAPTPRITKRSQPMSARALMLLLGGGGALVVMAAIFVFVFFVADFSEEPAPAPLAPRPSPPASSPAPLASSPSPVSSVALAKEEPPSPLASSPAPLASSPSPVSSAALAKEEPPSPLSSTGDLRVHEFLEKLRVAGIRASETDPKVIMNDRIYRVNDIVDKVTRLRLTRVETSALTFVDATGFEYRKNL